MIHLRVVSPPDVTGTLMPMLRSEPAAMNLTMLPGQSATPTGTPCTSMSCAGQPTLIIWGAGLEPRAYALGVQAWGSVLQLLLNVTVLTAVAVAGLPAQRAIWRRAARRARAAPSGVQQGTSA